ncbi:ABC-type metal ion transport system, periplasmic component/surface adhesin [Mycolicibacterium chubuense NBB4]|uniref:ABC-type metal ion transport system, periplasmic component/surface adhesin n=1 Tax=Mycolicibacterium chubuense (strain NBB4) TaxID=710421 RepID=I4BQ26_MYCCN|nr:zinc ABC transporter substrate-binding protein [Mycolicibacterium chubuense]AFM19383.1 ABC-type metal ion transport system, periplasmic component/surface adhesin [Mycolicibacterium chubuense NBB4]
MRALVAAGAAALLTVTVAACSHGQNAEHGTPNVVASTDVWGSVASAVVGDHATVTSIVHGTAADPHSFEASPTEVAKVADASLVVYNGGHYDRWMEDILGNAPAVPKVDAYSLLVPAQQPANEHVFYDLPTVKQVAEKIADTMGQADSAHAADYTAKADRFGEALDTLAMAERAIGESHPGASVVATEPVAYYALRNAGIQDKTPPSFANAMEEGSDPSPADVAAVLDLINAHKVSAIVINTQTESPVSKRISDAARKAALPVISVTETLPAGMDYLQWQRKTVDEIGAALASAPAPTR